MPVVPGKNETGTNTAISTSEVAMTALVTSAIAREVATCGSECSIEICRCTFSMTTIASSTTRPVANVIPNNVRELIEKPKMRIKAKVPIRETGIVTAGMIVARQSSRKRKITAITMMTASQGPENFLDRFAYSRRRIERNRILQARREALRQACQLDLGASVNIESIGV